MNQVKDAESLSPEKDGRSEYWLAHLESWRRSGLTQAEYYRRHDLKYTTFRKWKERLCNYYPLGFSLKLVELKVNSDSALDIKPFSSANGDRLPGRIRFWVGEFCIEVENDFSGESLERLIGIILRGTGRS